MADTGLGATTELTYNGITFDTRAEISVDQKAIKDDAKRTVLFQEITIKVRTIFSASDNATLNSNMQLTRAALNEPGRPLTFKNAGFGDQLLVNQLSGQGVKDVRFGPMPEVLTWEPVGSSRAVECVWTVVVCVPTCNQSGSLRSNGLMALNYGVSYSIDDGYTTRTMHGYLQIAMTRVPGSKRIPDCADIYRALVTPINPLGFKRNWAWDLSPDKARIDFTCTDTEIRSDNPYPMYCVNVSGEHDVQWSRGFGSGVSLEGGINMTLELDSQHNQQYGWNIFYTIIRARLAEIAQNKEMALLLTHVGIREDLWGKAASFQMRYRLVGANTVTEFVKAMIEQTGIWKPFGTDWTRWRTSMENIFDPYGTAILYQRPENDLIVDLCTNDSQIPWGGDRPGLSINEPPDKATFKNQKPDPKNSYLEYENVIVPRSETPVQRQRVMQEPSIGDGNGDMTQADGFLSPADGISADSISGPDGKPAPGPKPDIIQQSGNPSHSISLVGRAKRAGYPIPRPTLSTVGGQQPIETYFIMPQAIVADWFGVPIYEARWRIDYALASSPGKYPVQPNIKENLDANGN